MLKPISFGVVLCRIGLLLALFACAHAQGSTTIPYTGPSVPVPDNNAAGVNILLTVSGLGAITDLDFALDALSGCNATPGNANASVAHAFVGELVITLTSPAGTTAVLIDHRGGARSNFCTIWLNDEGGYPALSTISSDPTLYASGAFSPDSPLSAFDGEDPNGQWILNASDTTLGHFGSVKRFSLSLTTVPKDIVVDVIDDPNPSTCQPGSCSLREAVSLANSRLGPDRILLPASTQLQLTRAGAGEDNNLTGDLDVTEDLEVVGAGLSATILTQIAADRLFHQTAPGVSLTLRNLRLQGGSGVPNGGAIHVPSGGVLTITDAVVSGNRATELGGAIYHHGGGSDGLEKIVLQRVRFQDNEATNVTAAKAWGGAIYSLSAGFLTSYAVIDDCIFDGNRADDGAGAIAFDGVLSVSKETMLIRRSTFAHNQATASGGRGGAIATEVNDNGLVQLKISDSSFSENSVRNAASASVGERGGALSVNTGELGGISGSLFALNFAYSAGAIDGANGDISTTWFHHNQAVDTGGALRGGTYPPLTIRRSTLNNNSVTTSSTSAIGGGAVAITNGDLTIEHSTLDQNSALRGAAIAFGTGDLSLRGNTIVAPSSLPVGSLGSVLRYTGTATADSIVFVNNILIGQCSYANAGIQPDASFSNIESVGNTCRLQLPILQSGNQVLTAQSAINLGVLGDNGGPTWTRMLQIPSVAKDTGYQFACIVTPQLDQRGYFVTDAQCDIGAVEVDGMLDALFADDFEG